MQFGNKAESIATMRMCVFVVLARYEESRAPVPRTSKPPLCSLPQGQTDEDIEFCDDMLGKVSLEAVLQLGRLSKAVATFGRFQDLLRQ